MYIGRAKKRRDSILLSLDSRSHSIVLNPSPGVQYPMVLIDQSGLEELRIEFLLWFFFGKEDNG